MSLDYLEGHKPEVDKLEELTALVQTLISKRKGIDLLEEQLKAEKKIERTLSQEEIPSLLLEQGLTSITLESGEKITIVESVHVSLPKDTTNRNIVLKWLIENGGENLIKKEFVIDEPEEHVKEYLLKTNVPFTYVQNVHFQTLKAFFKAKLGMSKGSLQEIEISEIPKEANLFVLKETKIK